MRRGTAISACFLIGVSTLLAAGQPPAQPPAGKKPPAKKADKAPADPLDGLIGAALVNDPDVRMAQAKLQLADAELAKARQQVTLKVVALNGAIHDQRRSIAALRVQLEMADARFRAALAPRTEMIAVQEKLEAAQAMLARSEAELKLITTGRVVGAAPEVGGAANAEAARLGMTWLQFYERLQSADYERMRDRQRVLEAYRAWAAGVATGTIPDRVRAALDKKVSLGAKGQTVSFEKAMEMIKAETGLDVPVRTGFKIVGVETQGEAIPVGAWFQLFADYNSDLRFLVREYGILVTTKELAPPDAVTVTQFWHLKPVPKAGGAAPKADGQ